MAISRQVSTIACPRHSYQRANPGVQRGAELASNSPLRWCALVGGDRRLETDNKAEGVTCCSDNRDNSLAISCVGPYDHVGVFHEVGRRLVNWYEMRANERRSFLGLTIVSVQIHDM